MGAQRPQKRRKVAESNGLASKIQMASLSSLEPDAQSSPTLSFVCSTCRRAFRPVKGSQPLCSRCLTPTCTICSRTCTASRSSMPPTPSLTRSPTPNTTPSQSPQRVALSLQPANTNIPDTLRGMDNGTPHAGKRRKHEDATGLKESLEQTLSDYALGPGCGRLVCKRCCSEDLRSETTMCTECQYGSYSFS